MTQKKSNFGLRGDRHEEPVCLAALAVAASATPAFAEMLAGAPASKIDAGDTAWMIAATALVLMMTIPGLALFYCGMVRKKNVLATMAQSVAAVCLVSILWALLGYTLAFSGDAPALGNLERAFLRGIGMDSVSPLAKTIPESLFMIYQMTFAIITVALVSGAVADRCASRRSSVLGIVAVPRLRAARALGLGRRFPADMGRARLRRRHRGAYQCRRRRTGRRTGTGQAARLRHGKSGALRSLAGCDRHRHVVGRLVRLQWRLGARRRIARLDGDRRDASCGLRRRAHLDGARMGEPRQALGARHHFGAIAGLGTITPASGFVLPWHGIVIGVIAGGGCYWACTKLKLWLGYDDSLDVFGVHGVGGAIGTTLTGVFAVAAISMGPDSPGGSPGLLENNPAQVATQLIGVAVTVAWSGVLTFVILKLVGFITPLRVTPEAEQMGLDISLHGESIHS
jgi:Amt family ammonium transporter